jgi:outer membrane protein OmpA-like peptidoglycan-associated protein
MFKRNVTVCTLMAVVAALAMSGCVTKKVFRKNVEDTGARIEGVESAVAVDVGNNALAEAQSAQKLAKGKILWSVTLSDDKTKFGFGQAKIPEEALRELDQLAAQVQGMDRAVYVEIEGHTDNIGDAQYNEKLGQERAEAVRDYLHEKGLPLHAMNVISYGESRPVTDNQGPKARAQNRRVVVRVLE